MAKQIFEELINQKFFRLPSVYIRPEIDEDVRKKLIVILRNLQCEITEDKGQATHIIYPDIDPFPEEYARPSFQSGNNVMMHWYYLPESNDSWIPNTFKLKVSIKRFSGNSN